MNAEQDPQVMRLADFRTSCLRLAGVFIGMATLDGSHADERPVSAARVVAAADTGVATGKAQERRMWMTAGGRRFAVALAETEAARAFVARLPLTLDMTDLNGNEKKFDLPKNLPAHPIRAGTIRSGDLMLWGDNTVVVFYMTFDSPYSYTAGESYGLRRAPSRGCGHDFFVTVFFSCDEAAIRLRGRAGRRYAGAWFSAAARQLQDKAKSGRPCCRGFRRSRHALQTRCRTCAA